MTMQQAIGSMRETITLHEEQRTVGAGGRVGTAHPILASCWASAEENNNIQTIAGSRKHHRRVTFRIRYQRDLMAATHVSWQGQRFTVTSLRPTGAPATWLEVIADCYE